MKSLRENERRARDGEHENKETAELQGRKARRRRSVLETTINMTNTEGEEQVATGEILEVTRSVNLT